MSKKSSSKIRSVILSILSFVLCILFVALSMCAVLEATVFNPDFIIDNMNSSNYFIDKRDEITRSLKDLGYASGLEEEFFDGLLDEAVINNNTRDYLENFYEGNGASIDLTDFKQKFNAALDEYIAENNIENVDSSSRTYLITNATNIYRHSLEIPLFSRISAYLLVARNAMPFVIGGLLVIVAIIITVFFLANKWKHRAVKYCYFACAGAFLSVGVFSAVVLISGKIEKINLSSRALYNLFVQCGNNVMIAMLFCALFFLLLAVACFIQHRYMRKKVISD